MRRAWVVGEWVVAQRNASATPTDWVNLLVVPLRGKGRYGLGWNGMRFSANGEDARLERDWPGALEELADALSAISREG